MVKLFNCLMVGRERTNYPWQLNSFISQASNQKIKQSNNSNNSTLKKNLIVVVEL